VNVQRITLWAAGAGAAVAVAAPSAAAVSQLFAKPAGKPVVGASCGEVVTRTLDFARHYTVAARVYAAPGPAKGLPKLVSASERGRCGNPERLLERIVPAAPRKPAG
jgi:hypothetical protein